MYYLLSQGEQNCQDSDSFKSAFCLTQVNSLSQFLGDFRTERLTIHHKYIKTYLFKVFGTNIALSVIKHESTFLSFFTCTRNKNKCNVTSLI